MGIGLAVDNGSRITIDGPHPGGEATIVTLGVLPTTPVAPPANLPAQTDTPGAPTPTNLAPVAPRSPQLPPIPPAGMMRPGAGSGSAHH
jgi:hypothetical protein